MYRLQNGIDNYAMGRVPWFCENAVFVGITDGGAFETPCSRAGLAI